MVSITLSVPGELKKEMNKHPELNWSEVARQAIRKKLLFLKKIDKLLVKSRLTEEDALELGARASKAAARKFLKSV